MYTYSSPRLVTVRPEMDRLDQYAPGESLEAFSARTGIPLGDIIKLNSNESPYEPAPSVLKALSNFSSYNHYPDANSAALRSALATYAGVEEHHIVVHHGSSELINLLWHLFLSVGDNVLCCPPTFSLYTSVTSFCGAHVLEVSRKENYEVDIDAVLTALTPQTKLIVLTSPNNPTGNAISEQDILTLLDTGRIVILDEAYVEFSDRPRGFAHLVPQYENLVVMRTFSKWAGLAGLRIGYALMPDWIQAYMRRAQCPFEVNIAGHIAAIETLKALDYTLNDVRRIVEERERLFAMLSRYSFFTPFPSQGNFILTRVDESQVKVNEIRSAVEKQGILLRYFSQPAMRNFIRVTVGKPEHTDNIDKALHTLL
ncbi:histidinol-phosphate transaminase [Ktedonospora formicarum]|uniref:Histidinol-phosphate aminotransferase n=1 Tax=Ktedonospora formicarum TaxID=2778364 RepID=A0A8J3MTF2_9CHLR|nr:histidinol-phosphate transaminase [Ktedonospora formicarum]GHO44315.1 histidinol-phosphate aminotransferase [Ktedonospora formicarum]